MRRVGAFAIGLLLFLPAGALAFVPPTHLDHRETIQVATGPRARVQPSVTWQAPASSASEWQRFLQMRGVSWRAYWDADRKIPARIFGEGIPIRSVAEVRTILAEHLPLLAPGASIDDFEQVSDHFDPQTGIRSLGFVQKYRGVRVLGGQISARVENGRLFVIGSEAFPHVRAELPLSQPSRALRDEAAKWIAKDFGSYAVAREKIEGPFVLPIVREDGTITHHGVHQVTVDARDPIGRWSVWLDASGAPVARKQTLLFANGTVQFNAPDRHPGGTRLDFGAPFARVTIGGQTTNTDATGAFSFADGAPATVTVRTKGAEAVVFNQAGADATHQFTIADGQTYVWNAADDEYVDAQITTFIASNIAKERCKIIAPDMTWLFTDPVEAYVNYADTCNAFSDGTTINFFSASEQCENTGRLADVVHHEFGHSFHAHAIIQGVGDFDTALSEGGADYLAATIANDPGMGRGFFYSDRPLRHLDQAMGEATWPNDIGEPHVTGIIFGGAMWDLRKSLVASMGEPNGVAYTDRLFYAVFQRATDIPSSYVEVLAADDDDGNLANGTPNMCAINEAFARHGLADPETVGPPLGLPERTGFTVFLPLGTRTSECPGDAISNAVLVWRLRQSPSTGGTLTLGAVSGGFSADIPPQAPGQVVEYRIEVTTPNAVINFPSNRAAPWYEMFVGEVIDLYCNDFESDPTDEFTHELLAGQDREGADDWQWGVPAGTSGSGDPDRAFSGMRVYGNDLGGGNYNGRYQPNKQNVLHAPAVDVLGHTNVRLQYRRWLNVEDGNYDQAIILSNGQQVWSNLDTGNGGNTHHEDREWIFHDVDLSNTIRDGRVQVDFQLRSDGGLEFGGWTIDDFCIVAVMPTAGPRCGDGVIDPGEACDDGNGTSGDGCELDCTITPKPVTCGDGVVDAGEACDDGNSIDGDGCQSNCTRTPTMMMPDPMNPDPMLPDGLEEEEGGCGCTMGPRSGATSTLPLLLLVGLLLLRRRR